MEARLELEAYIDRLTRHFPFHLCKSVSDFDPYSTFPATELSDENASAEHQAPSKTGRPKTPDALSDTSSEASVYYDAPLWSAPASPADPISPASSKTTSTSHRHDAVKTNGRKKRATLLDIFNTDGKLDPLAYDTEPEITGSRVTDCMQCEYKRLPCNQAIPACSRCIRHGHGDDCLPQARMSVHPKKIGFPQGYLRCLARVPGDLESGRWERKVKLMQEMKAKRNEERERRNWALPPVEGARKGFFRAKYTKVDWKRGTRIYYRNYQRALEEDERKNLWQRK